MFLESLDRFGEFLIDLAGFGYAWIGFGLDCFGEAWQGLARFCCVWIVLVRFWTDLVRFGLVWLGLRT